MKYLSFFRLRFAMGLQYRTAALAGIVTQFVWGFMEIMIFKAFYRADAASFPMSFQATVSYIWLQQAFLDNCGYRVRVLHPRDHHDGKGLFRGA